MAEAIEPSCSIFPLHDLTHFAVESALGFRCGFYGLIAQGWEIDDTTGKGSRGPLPDETTEVEFFVGLFDNGRASGTLLTADDFNNFAATQAEAAGGQAPRIFSTEDLARVRELRSKLFAQWSSIAPGETLELYYESPPIPRPINTAGS